MESWRFPRGTLRAWSRPLLLAQVSHFNRNLLPWAFKYWAACAICSEGSFQGYLTSWFPKDLSFWNPKEVFQESGFLTLTRPRVGDKTQRPQRGGRTVDHWGDLSGFKKDNTAQPSGWPPCKPKCARHSDFLCENLILVLCN